MQEEELVKIVKEVIEKKCETQYIELKSAKIGCPTKLFDTLSAFSNQDQGGIIIFGIDENNNFEINDVYNVQDLQHKINEQCKQMEPVVRPLFTTCLFENKVIVSAEIPGVDITLRPVFYKGVGRIKGSYVRVGESDELMSEYEIYSYEVLRKRINDDLRIVENYRIDFFNKDRINEYLKAVKEQRPNLSNNVSDDNILEMMGIKINNIPTLAGLMIFSNYPQAQFPQLSIVAVSLPGTEMGVTGSDNERFLDNKRITGSIIDMLDEAVEFVRKNSRVKIVINDYGERVDRTEYPLIAVREAILNALVHRDYSIYTENTPIRIEMYRDRLEIINSGGLYGKISVDLLGKVRAETRNPTIANILELLGKTENRYSGIPTIRNEFLKANLPEPVFSVSRGEFKVTMKNSFLNDENDLINNVIEYCSIPRSRNELALFIGKSKNHVMSKIINPLIKEGKLMMTLPEKPNSSFQKYIKAK